MNQTAKNGPRAPRERGALTDRLSDPPSRSELFYRALFNAAGVAVFLMQGDRFVECNPKTYEMFGCTREQILGATPDRFSPPVQPDGQPSVEKGEDLMERTGTQGARSFEWRHCRLDRSEFDAEVTLTPIELEGESHVLAVVRDVTESKRTEAALRESEARFRRIVDLLPQMISLVGKDGRYRFVNKSYEKILGRPASAFIGRPPAEILGSAAAVKRERNVTRALAGETVHFNEEYDFGDGNVRYLDGHLIPDRDPDGEITGIYGVLTDITAFKQAQEERQQLETQMQQVQKLESLGVLAGGIAHDFNNLLMAIIGNIDLCLQTMAADSPARPLVDEIEKAARRAADLVEQMLAYSGKGHFLVRPVNLTEIVEEMGHILSVSISKKADLRYSFARDLPAVEADVVQLQQVIMNLILNASEALGDENGVITVTTECAHFGSTDLARAQHGTDEPPGQYVYLEVSDSGVGMDSETLAMIFDPFYTTKFTGRGLGLAAVLGIVRGHRGFLRVSSTPEAGTTFIVGFPASEAPAEQLSEPSPPRSDWSGSGTILLVDDEEALRDLGTRMLQRLGFEVLTAADGHEAIAVYREHPGAITCVILDLTMPQLDGEETFRELRRLDPQARVVLSSGFDRQEVARRFAGKDTSGYIQKPYRLETLATALREILQ